MISITKQGKTGNKEKIVLPYLQKIGKALMFPIAVLPFAAIFLRISVLIPTDGSEFAKIVSLILSTIGNAVFGPVLPILFAIGISFGLTKDQRGEAALVGLIAMILIQLFISSSGGGFAKAGIGLVDLIYGNTIVSPGGTEQIKGFEQLFGNKYASIVVDNVLNGILVGIIVSIIYNAYSGIELPTILGFFSGRRLIPVLVLIFGLLFGILWAFIFPWIAWCIYYLSYYMGKATGNKYANAAIMGLYIFMNRLLIPFGMHHIPNTLFWFTLGSFETPSGDLINGDINIFLQGSVWCKTYGYNNAGTFQSGLFPLMMFGLPAIAFAFCKFAQNKEQSRRVASLLFGSALVTFFTGITEPIEFSFMFISPIIYLVYAALAAFWAFFIGLMQIQLGFGFSAGFIDYVLSIPKSMEIINAKLNGVVDSNGVFIPGIYNKAEAVFANPIMIIVVGLLCAISYYYMIKIAIFKFHIDTPGRGKNIIVNDIDNKENNLSNLNYKSNKYTRDAGIILKAIDIDNIVSVEWCATRLRFILKDNSKIDEKSIKKTISRGEIKVGNQGYQIIIGPNVEMIGNEIQHLMSRRDILDQINSNIENTNQKEIDNNKTVEIFSIGNGKVDKIENINDQVFSSKTIGDGIVIDCEDGKLYSPISGKLTAVFKTGHAYGITSKDGVSILIHIGIDTVNLDTKKIFKTFVKQDDEVQRGQLLCEFDRDEIIKQKIEHRVILVVTHESTKKITFKSKRKIVTTKDVVLKLK